jgi:UDP-glucose 4-epimerase
VAELVAESSMIKAAVGWRARYDDLEAICSTAFKWEGNLQEAPLS